MAEGPFTEAFYDFTLPDPDMGGRKPCTPIPCGEDMVDLRTGETVARATMGTTVMSIRALIGSNPPAVVELLALARDPSHQLFGDAGRLLESFSLTRNGVMHDQTRLVVLASFDGDVYIDPTAPA